MYPINEVVKGWRPSLLVLACMGASIPIPGHATTNSATATAATAPELKQPGEISLHLRGTYLSAPHTSSFACGAMLALPSSFTPRSPFFQLELATAAKEPSLSLGMGQRHGSVARVGYNIFTDLLVKQLVARVGTGLDLSFPYIAVSGNVYVGMNGWNRRKGVEPRSRLANGGDLRVEGWLPMFPSIGAHLIASKYFGSYVQAGNLREDVTESPLQYQAGVEWQPVPLVRLFGTAVVGGKSKPSGWEAGVALHYVFRMPFATQLSSKEIAEWRSSAYRPQRVVQRNYQLIQEWEESPLGRRVGSASEGEGSSIPGEIDTTPEITTIPATIEIVTDVQKHMPGQIFYADIAVQSSTAAIAYPTTTVTPAGAVLGETVELLKEWDAASQVQLYRYSGILGEPSGDKYTLQVETTAAGEACSTSTYWTNDVSEVVDFSVGVIKDSFYSFPDRSKYREQLAALLYENRMFCPADGKSVIEFTLQLLMNGKSVIDVDLSPIELEWTLKPSASSRDRDVPLGVSLDSSTTMLQPDGSSTNRCSSTDAAVVSVEVSHKGSIWSTHPLLIFYEPEEGCDLDISPRWWAIAKSDMLSLVCRAQGGRSEEAFGVSIAPFNPSEIKPLDFEEAGVFDPTTKEATWEWLRSDEHDGALLFLGTISLSDGGLLQQSLLGDGQAYGYIYRMEDFHLTNLATNTMVAADRRVYTADTLPSLWISGTELLVQSTGGWNDYPFPEAGKVPKWSVEPPEVGEFRGDVLVIGSFDPTALVDDEIKIVCDWLDRQEILSIPKPTAVLSFHGNGIGSGTANYTYQEALLATTSDAGVQGTMASVGDLLACKGAWGNLLEYAAFRSIREAVTADLQQGDSSEASFVWLYTKGVDPYLPGSAGIAFRISNFEICHDAVVIDEAGAGDDGSSAVLCKVQRLPEKLTKQYLYASVLPAPQQPRLDATDLHTTE